MISVRIESPNQLEVINLIEELDRLQNLLYPPEVNALLSIDELSTKDVIFLVAREADHDRVVGCVALVIQPSYGEVKRLYVSPFARDKGVGTLLMKELERQAELHGCRLVKLETGNRQPKAIGLYERLGYLVCQYYGDYKDNPFSVFMEKELK